MVEMTAQMVLMKVLIYAIHVQENTSALMAQSALTEVWSVMELNTVQMKVMKCTVRPGIAQRVAGSAMI